MGQWETGAKVRVACTFTVAKQPMNPTTVLVSIKKPDGTLVSPVLTPVQDGLGLYHVDVVCSQAGIYQWRWQGTGAVEAVHEGDFGITPSNFS